MVGQCLDASFRKHSSDCSKYYECVNGAMSMRTCGPETMFNHINSVCDWPANVYKVRPECLEGTMDETVDNNLLTYLQQLTSTSTTTESDPDVMKTTDTSYLIQTPDDHTKENLLVVATPRTPLPLCNPERLV